MTTFIIPKDPLLRWSLLVPRLHRKGLPPPFNTRQAQHVFWGRNAIYHGLHTLGIARGETVLVPAYHCAAVVEPVLQYGAHVTFYNVCRDCAPDFEDIAAKVTPATKAVVVIHYFGFPQPMREWQDFCQAHGLKLIEDCAHVLASELGGQSLGTFGDVSIFSLRKFFPLYDGGQLIVNNPSHPYTITWERASFLFSLKVAKNFLDKLSVDSGGGLARLLSRLVRLPSAIVQWVLSRGEAPSKTVTVNSYGVDFDLNAVNMRISGLSRYLLHNSDAQKIIEIRCANYRRLHDALAPFPELACLWPVLPDGICPLTFPVLVRHQDDFHLVLRDRGIPAVTWGGVIHRQLPLEEFPDARFLYKRLVCLPIHQDISREDIYKMAQVIGDALGRRSTD